jgi:hypothetical protein
MRYQPFWLFKGGGRHPKSGKKKGGMKVHTVMKYHVGVSMVVLIANLLITVLSRSIKRNCAFSQVVTMVRLMLIYYVDFIAFMEKPEKTWNDILEKQMQKAPPEPTLFD